MCFVILSFLLNFVPTTANSQDKIDKIIGKIREEQIRDADRLERSKRFSKKGLLPRCSTEFDRDYETCFRYIDKILLAVEQDQKFEEALIKLENGGIPILIVRDFEKIHIHYIPLFRSATLRVPLNTAPETIRSFLEIK